MRERLPASTSPGTGRLPRKRLRRRRSGAQEPRPIAVAAGELAASLVPPTALASIQQRWEEAVGPDLAAHAEPVAERNGTVTINCRDAVWAAELELQSRTLMERLSHTLEVAGEAREIKTCRFVVGPLEGT